MGDRSGMSISADSPSDETLNRGPLALLLWRQYEFPFGINIVQFSNFNFQSEAVLYMFKTFVFGITMSGDPIRRELLCSSEIVGELSMHTIGALSSCSLQI